MSDPLGLSIGTTNLVAARVGNQPVTRRSVLPRAGQVLSGFVERVGDPVPLIADDGTSYRADLLMIEALDAMVVEAGSDESSQVAVAVPAHWTGATLRSLRDAMRTTPSLAPNGVPVRLVSDAVAALTALAANPGLPMHGVLALLDFGGGGTSVTLADGSASFEPIETTRLTEFSGDQIDQSLLAHVLDGIAREVDPASTAAVGSLTRLRDECRRAKEELSESAVADIRVELPGHQSTVRVTRDELDALMEAPLAAVLSELNESLLRNRIAAADVSAVVAVGGGARIPLVTRRLSERDRGSFVTTPHPALDAAVGAALFAAYGADADAQTGVAPTPLIAGAAAAAAAPDSSTFRALAWSQDDDTVGDPAPYTGEDPYADSGTARAVAQYHPRQDDEPRSWQRLPQLIFGIAAVVALVAVGGVAVALTSTTDETQPTPSTAPVTATSPPAPPPTSIEPPPPPPATEAPPQNVVTVTSEAPPPPPPPPPSTETVTVAPPVTTTATTTQPTTTTTTPTTTTTTTTSSTPTMTTSYITVPFVPVPIPIQVPSTPTPYQPYQPPVYQQPQYPY